MKRFICINLCLISILLSSCNNSNSPHRDSTFLLGTIIEIESYSKYDSKLNQKAFKRVAEIESKMTINGNGKSEIENLNSVAGKDFVELSSDTFYVLSKGKYYSEISDGRFDITIGPIVKLWNIGTDGASKPAQSMIDEKKFLVDYKKLILQDENRAKLVDKNMIVDLGAVAKGYVADEVKKILKDGGIDNALINIGGTVMSIGSKVDGDSWNIGIQNPFESRNQYIAIVKIDDEVVSSSGDYEKYFEEDGVRYHHILDSATGYPCDNEISGVSIIASHGIDADSMSTVVFLSGVKKGLEIVNQIDGIEAVIVTKDREVYLSDGLDESKFKLTDNSFIVNYN